MLNYALLSILEKGKTIVGKRDIQLLHITQYIYGISFSLSIYSLQNLNIAMNKKYIAKFEEVEVELYLLNKTHEKVGDMEYNVFTLTQKNFTMQKKNNSNFHSLVLDELVNERAKQLKRISFALRKKGMMWSLNDKLVTTHTTFQNAVSKKAKKVNLKLVRINTIKKRRENYYCLEDGTEYSRTTKGAGDPIFLPFAKKKDIQSLDSFVTPTHKAITELTTLKIGDMVKIEEEKKVVMEVEIMISSNIKSYIIFGSMA